MKDLGELITGSGRTVEGTEEMSGEEEEGADITSTLEGIEMTIGELKEVDRGVKMNVGRIVEEMRIAEVEMTVMEEMTDTVGTERQSKLTRNLPTVSLVEIRHSKVNFCNQSGRCGPYRTPLSKYGVPSFLFLRYDC